MSINIKTDPLRSAILFGRPVLFTPQRIPREDVPEGWYYYELRGSVRNAKKPIALSDRARINPIGSVLSPVPLKRADTISRRVNRQFLLLGETMTLRDYCRNNSLEYPFHNQTFAIASKDIVSQPEASFGDINDMYVVVSFYGGFGAWLGGQAFFFCIWSLFSQKPGK